MGLPRPPGFIEARHKYLSARHGSATEESEPLAGLSAFDQVWWRLDGLSKSHARRRAELDDLVAHQRNAVTAIQGRLEEAIQSRRTEMHERLARELAAMQIDDQDRSVALNRVVTCRPGAAEPLPSLLADEGPWVRPILQGANEWIAFEHRAREQKELLASASEFINRHLGHIVELQSAQPPSGFVSREGLVECARD